MLVVTVKALRHHGGAVKEALLGPNPDAVEKGLPNMEKHIENLKLFGMHPVVCINRFPTDSVGEISLIKGAAAKYNVQAIECEAFAKGGEGATDLAEAVKQVVEGKLCLFRPLFDKDAPVEQKIKMIATQIYGANDVAYSVKARNNLKTIRDLGFDKLPVCMAKTPKSLSDDEHLLGRPRDFVATVREFEFASGAGFVIPILGDMMRMPGLPTFPAAENIDLTDEGKVVGLF